MAKIINGKEFEKEVLMSGEPVFVDFYADWCGPCRMLAPILEEISKSHKVVKINVDDENELAGRYGIMSIPCVILFKNGKEAGRSIGLRPKDEILKLLGE
ncbi:MAG: thioredoxin [Clostridia bacterium]|nr:thioredoxin [Clostridia bacterium]